jgi:hypothetical protein
LPLSAASGGAGRVPERAAFRRLRWQPTPPVADRHVTKLDIITPGPEIDDDPAAIALWNDTGNFIGTALARMERGRAFSIILARLQHDLQKVYGAEDARKVIQAIMDTME